MLNPEAPSVVITARFFKGSHRRQKELHDYLKWLNEVDEQNRKMLGIHGASDPRTFPCAVQGDR